jgi:hypothetical protein
MFLFGQTTTAIHLGLLLVNSATERGDLLCWEGTGEFYRRNCRRGQLRASFPQSIGARARRARNSFCGLPVLGGAFLLLNQQNRFRRGAALVSGLLMGLSLLMKQPALFFVLFDATYLFLGDVRAGLVLRKAILRNLGFGGGAVTPLVITFLALYYTGVFAKFWFWTIHYAHEYGTLVSISEAPHIFIQSVSEAIGPNWSLWIVAGVGLLTCPLNKSTNSSAGFLFGLLISSILALCSGFYFRSHYFILLLPAVAPIRRRSNQQYFKPIAPPDRCGSILRLLLFAPCAGFLVFAQRDLFFLLSPVEVSHTIYNGNPFPDTIKVA